MNTLPPVPLSVLDLAPVGEGASTTEALQATIGLARRADALGYTRFWVAEHHNMPGIASSAPAVLIGAHRRRDGHASGSAPAASCCPTTRRSRSPSSSARWTRCTPAGSTSALGRAPGTDQLTAAALRRCTQAWPPTTSPTSSASWPASWPTTSRRSTRSRASPRCPAATTCRRRCGCSGPAVTAPSWPACSACRSRSRTTSAARTRCRRSRPTATRSARGGCSPSPTRWSPPQAVCAPTDEEAERLALPSALSFLRLRQGRPGRDAHAGAGRRAPVDAGRAAVRPRASRRPGHRQPGHRPRRARRGCSRRPRPTS